MIEITQFADIKNVTISGRTISKVDRDRCFRVILDAKTLEVALYYPDEAGLLEASFEGTDKKLATFETEKAVFEFVEKNKLKWVELDMHEPSETTEETKK
jgi:hypothetical protein